jgi:hypothetical protein
MSGVVSAVVHVGRQADRRGERIRSEPRDDFDTVGIGTSERAQSHLGRFSIERHHLLAVIWSRGPSHAPIHVAIFQAYDYIQHHTETMSSKDQSRHALVLGASGITGWAIVNAMLEDYPTKTTFGKITAVTNRPLSHEASQWPADSRLQMVSGLDLMAGSQDALHKAFEQKIPGIDTVSHLYFYGKN